MNRFERIKAALHSQEVDRVPVSLWMHFSDSDQDPRSLAAVQVDFARKYDFDFIKLMPFGLYGVQDYGAKIRIFNRINQPPVIDKYGITSIKDWGRIEALPAHYGTLGKQVQLARYVQKLSKGEFPYIQTIFSPLTNARKLAGDRILLDLKRDPKLFKQALQAITDTTLNFIKANLEAGVSGFFFATQCANYDFMTEEEYREFGEYFDLQVINAYNDITFFNVVHLHGESGMFDLIERYPGNCINWHDRWTVPNLAQAREKTGKCLMGGIREIPYYDEKHRTIRNNLLVDGTIDEVETHVREAIEQVNRKGLIIGPGCVVDQLACDDNIRAVRRAVSSEYEIL